jgi:lysozyme
MEFEGCKLHVYDDVNALPTIGVGHLLGGVLPQRDNGAAGAFPAPYGAFWAERVVSSCVKVALSQDAFDALVSLVFNVGSGTFEHSSVLTHVNAGAPEQAALALLAYCHADGVVVPGLLRRRQVEAALLRPVES